MTVLALINSNSRIAVGNEFDSINRLPHRQSGNSVLSGSSKRSKTDIAAPLLKQSTLKRENKQGFRRDMAPWRVAYLFSVNAEGTVFGTKNTAQRCSHAPGQQNSAAREVALTAA